MCRRTLLLFISALFLYLTQTSVASSEMTSTSFRIASSVLSEGGGYATSASLGLYSTFGQSSPPGNGVSASFSLDSGFWCTLLQTIMGDVNGDDEVNLGDVIIALQIITGQSSAEVRKEADVNGDGVIGLSEAIMVLRKLVE